MDARKERVEADAAWTLLKTAGTITTAKGKKVKTWNPRTHDKAIILKHAMGPSGNLRAPTFRIKDKFIIGFNPELYGEWVG